MGLLQTGGFQMTLKGEIEEIILEATGNFPTPMTREYCNQKAIQVLSAIKGRMISEERLLDKFIPEVYCDVIPDAKEVYAIRKVDNQLVKYKLRQDSGKKLAKAICNQFLNEVEG